MNQARYKPKNVISIVAQAAHRNRSRIAREDVSVRGGGVSHRISFSTLKRTVADAKVLSEASVEAGNPAQTDRPGGDIKDSQGARSIRSGGSVEDDGQRIKAEIISGDAIIGAVVDRRDVIYEQLALVGNQVQLGGLLDEVLGRLTRFGALL